MTTWSTCCWRTRSHPSLRCTTGIYRRWDANSRHSGCLICWLEATEPSITQLHSAAPAGEVRRLAERQHGEPLQRLRQLVLRTIWKQSEVLDHLQQPLGTSGRRGTVRSLSCGQMYDWRVLSCVSVHCCGGIWNRGTCTRTEAEGNRSLQSCSPHHQGNSQQTMVWCRHGWGSITNPATNKHLCTWTWNCFCASQHDIFCTCATFLEQICKLWVTGRSE